MQIYIAYNIATWTNMYYINIILHNTLLFTINI